MALVLEITVQEGGPEEVDKAEVNAAVRRYGKRADG